MGRIPSQDAREIRRTWPSRAIRWLLKPPRRCPHCRSREIRFSHRRTFLDSALGYVLLTPFRCLDCRARFFRPSLPRPRQTGQAAPSHRVVEARSELIQAGIPLPELPVRARFVLILDNDPAIRKLLSRLLERAGFLVSALAGIEDMEVRPGRIDLLIADFGSMRPTDLDIVRQLPEMHPEMKTIELSSQLADSVAPPSRLVLTKPFHTDALLEMVQQALGGPEMNRPLAEAGPHITSEGA